MAQRLLLDGREVWLKRYAHRRRRLAHHALDFAARQLDIEPLRPDPVDSPEEARRIESRRRGTWLRRDVGSSLSLPLRLREVAGSAGALGFLALLAFTLLADYLPDRDSDLFGLSFLIDYLT